MHNSPKIRDGNLDLARTVAIFGVILVHTTGIGFGRFGVQLFFLLSGYLLANYRSSESTSSFLFRRAARLFPLYLFILTVFHLQNDYSKSLLNWFLIGNFTWTTPQIPGGWSISSEWIFSIVLALIGLQTRKKLYLLISLSMMMQILTGVSVFLLGGADSESNIQMYQYLTWLNTTNPLVNLSFFLIGVAMRRDFLPTLKSKLVLFCLVLFPVLVDMIVGHVMVLWNFGMYALFICCRSIHLGKVATQVFSFIGQRTYGMFFFHFIVMDPVAGALSQYIVHFTLVIPFLYFTTVFLLSLICGAVSWILIESPALKITKRIQQKFGDL
jgi:peptidoglycan/LPS O-acetylase OafA/YrhL